MRKIFTLLTILTVASHAWSQMSIFEVGGKEDRADRLYYQFSYAGAINLYKAVLSENPTLPNPRVELQIAECYRKLNQPAQAADWYKKLTGNDTLFGAEQSLRYAQVLKGSGQYADAKIWYKRYQQLSGDGGNQANIHLSALANLDVYFKDSAAYAIHPVNFNSELSDFSPMFYEDGLVFVSARQTAEVRLVENVFNWDKQPYLDLFYVGPDSAGLMGKPIPWNDKLNTQYHEGPLAFFDDGQRVLFTRNNFYQGRFRKSSDNINKLKLYSALKNGDTWTQLTSLPFNSDEYSVGHPTFLADGKTMIFVSDMPGTEGGTDLWKSVWNGQDWSTPENLGKTLNTPGNEMFPFFHADGTLYFASDGLGGLGGLDIYKSEWEEGTFGTPKNMGYPVNTHFDDFGIIMDGTGIQGYFSSNRDSLEDDNIFQITITREPYLRINGMVVDDITGEPLPNTPVTMTDSRGKEITVQSDEEARFIFDLTWDEQYGFDAEKKLYDQINHPRRTAEDTPEAREPLEIRMKNRCWVYEWALNDKETGMPVVGARVKLSKEGSQEGITLIGKEGVYLLPLECGEVYDLHIEKNGYFNKTLKVTSEEIPEPEFEQIIVGKAIRVDNIYYDLAKADIRSDAAVELDKLVELLNENPSIEIELSSHTDSRGSDPYNLDLSQRRAESAVQYIIDQGIAADRIVARGYGETRLNNECDDGVPCSKEQHQENRRTEFAVTKVREGITVEE